LPDNDKSRQKVLSEYIASVFINNKTLKLEKVLMLFGTGANGKGVVYEVSTALLGSENISNYSLTQLTDVNGYFRAMIINKLLNYSSENGAKIDPNFFKQLASGEDIPARLPYAEPFMATDYAKLVFNCNKLPKEGVEQTDAFFRRFLIIPFDVTIPEDKQDKELHLRIISNELPGIFNWVLEGLTRLLAQKDFTSCERSKQSVNEYREQSDSVASFIQEEDYVKAKHANKPLKLLYEEYAKSCKETGNRAVSLNEFSRRLGVKGMGYEIEKKQSYRVVYIRKSGDPDEGGWKPVEV
jgi:putative DNA primase/helicase